MILLVLTVAAVVAIVGWCVPTTIAAGRWVDLAASALLVAAGATYALAVRDAVPVWTVAATGVLLVGVWRLNRWAWRR